MADNNWLYGNWDDIGKAIADAFKGEPVPNKVVKPPLSEEKFNENIDKIIEFTEKSRTHGYGGPNTDYAAARYLIEDMAERAGRDDVKPTEVIDTIKNLTNSGGAESQRQYLRDQFGPQADDEKKVSANPVIDVISESARRISDEANRIVNPNRDDSALREAFSDDVVDAAQTDKSNSLESDEFSV